MSRSLLINTLFYGTAKVSRLVGYALVALWYPIGGQTDYFFLLYTVALFFTTRISVVLGEVLVSSMSQLNIRRYGYFVLPLGFLSFIFLQDNLLGLLALYSFLGIISALFSGAVTVSGKTYRAPLASIVGLILTVLWAYVGQGEGLDLTSVGEALVIGELGRILVLLGLFRGSEKKELSFPWVPMLKQLLLISLFGLPPIISRFDASLLETGAVTTLSYASGISGLVVTFTTSGILVTMGLSSTLNYFESLRKGLSWVVFGTVGLIVPIAWLSPTISLITIVLILGVPFYYAAFSAYAYLLTFKNSFSFLFILSLLYVLLFTGLSWEMLQVWGVLGIAGALTLSEVILAIGLNLGVYKIESSLWVKEKVLI